MIQQIKEQSYLSIVAVLNRRDTDVYKFLNIMDKFCKQKFTNYEFIFVDNNAPKNTIDQIINQLNNSGIRANLVNFPYEVNKERAILAGVDAAIGDYVFEFEDTDVDYSSDDLWNMYQTCLAGNDIVLLKSSYKTSFVEQMFYKVLAKYSHRNTTFYSSRVHLISRRAINRINNINQVVYYRKYAYCNSGLDHGFVEYKPSKSIKLRKLDWQHIDFATDLLIIFTNLGKRVTMAFGLLFMLLSILTTAYTVVVYATMNVIHGWTTLMLFLSVSFTGVFLCFSMIIKYLNLLLVNQQRDETLIASKRRI